MTRLSSVAVHVALLPCIALFGCTADGVSLGTEELCTLDERLAAALERSNDEQVSNCSEIGDNVLANASFERPLVSECGAGLFCLFPAAEVNGWSTTSAGQVIELWADAHQGVPSPDGAQFVELNARSADTVYQDVALPAGQLMVWSLVHRGRNGIESIDLRIGPADAPFSQGILSSAEDAWYSYSGLYRVGTESLTRFALVSRSGVDQGNLVDAVVFAPVD